MGICETSVVTGNGCHACEGYAVRRKAFSRQKEHSAPNQEKPKISRPQRYKKLSEMSDGFLL
jgi:hypothetical protein